MWHADSSLMSPPPQVTAMARRARLAQGLKDSLAQQQRGSGRSRRQVRSAAQWPHQPVRAAFCPCVEVAHAVGWWMQRWSS